MASYRYYKYSEIKARKGSYVSHIEQCFHMIIDL
jgi:hypothetical protein